MLFRFVDYIVFIIFVNYDFDVIILFMICFVLLTGYALRIKVHVITRRKI